MKILLIIKLFFEKERSEAEQDRICFDLFHLRSHSFHINFIINLGKRNRGLRKDMGLRCVNPVDNPKRLKLLQQLGLANGDEFDGFASARLDISLVVLQEADDFLAVLRGVEGQISDENVFLGGDSGAVNVKSAAEVVAEDQSHRRE